MARPLAPWAHVATRVLAYLGLLLVVGVVGSDAPWALGDVAVVLIVGGVVLYLELRRVVRAAEQRLLAEVQRSTHLLDQHLHTLEHDLEAIDRLVRARP